MSTKNNSGVPPTEPATTGATATETAPPTSRGQIAGSAFTADLDKHAAAAAASFWFWIGALPGLPVENVAIGGQTFPKLEERLLRGSDGAPQRVPSIGALVKLTAQQARKILDGMPRTVVRFREPKGEYKVGVGENVSVVMGEPKRRKGFLITIRSEQECVAREQAGYAAVRYERQEFDEPASDYLFAKLCPDQANPGHSEHYPEPLSKTGIQWPPGNL